LILAYSTHPTCQVEGRSSPGPGLPGRTGHTTRPDREFNPMQSGQNPLHLYAGSSGLRIRAGTGSVKRTQDRIASRVPRASYLPDRRARLSWPGATGRTRRTVMTGGGQNPMHQCHPRARPL